MKVFSEKGIFSTQHETILNTKNINNTYIYYFKLLFFCFSFILMLIITSLYKNSYEFFTFYWGFLVLPLTEYWMTSRSLSIRNSVLTGCHLLIFIGVVDNFHIWKLYQLEMYATLFCYYRISITGLVGVNVIFFILLEFGTVHVIKAPAFSWPLLLHASWSNRILHWSRTRMKENMEQLVILKKRIYLERQLGNALILNSFGARLLKSSISISSLNYSNQKNISSTSSSTSTTQNEIINECVLNNILSPSDESPFTRIINGPVEPLKRMRKHECALIAFKQIFHGCNESIADSTISLNMISQLITHLSVVHRVSIVKRFGDVYIGCIGFFEEEQNWGTSDENTKHIIQMACDLFNLSKDYNINFVCAIDYGRIVGGFIDNLFHFDFFGPEILWVLSVCESTSARKIVLSKSVLSLLAKSKKSIPFQIEECNVHLPDRKVLEKTACIKNIENYKIFQSTTNYHVPFEMKQNLSDSPLLPWFIIQQMLSSSKIDEYIPRPIYPHVEKSSTNYLQYIVSILTRPTHSYQQATLIPKHLNDIHFQWNQNNYDNYSSSNYYHDSSIDYHNNSHSYNSNNNNNGNGNGSNKFKRVSTKNNNNNPVNTNNSNTISNNNNNNNNETNNSNNTNHTNNINNNNNDNNSINNNNHNNNQSSISQSSHLYALSPDSEAGKLLSSVHNIVVTYLLRNMITDLPSYLLDRIKLAFEIPFKKIDDVNEDKKNNQLMGTIVHYDEDTFFDAFPAPINYDWKNIKNLFISIKKRINIFFTKQIQGSITKIWNNILSQLFIFEENERVKPSVSLMEHIASRHSIPSNINRSMFEVNTPRTANSDDEVSNIDQNIIQTPPHVNWSSFKNRSHYPSYRYSDTIIYGLYGFLCFYALAISFPDSRETHLTMQNIGVYPFSLCVVITLWCTLVFVDKNYPPIIYCMLIGLKGFTSCVFPLYNMTSIRTYLIVLLLWNYFSLNQDNFYFFFDLLVTLIILFTRSHYINDSDNEIRSGFNLILGFLGFFFLHSIIVEYYTYVCYLIEHSLIPYQIQLCQKEIYNAREICHKYTPQIPPSLAADLYAPRKYRKCAILAFHIKAAESIPAVVDVNDVAVLISFLYSFMDECVTQFGLLSVSQFSGVHISVICEDEIFQNALHGSESSVSYIQRAVVCVRYMQNKLKKFNTENSMNITLGVSLSHGSAYIGLLGDTNNLQFDVSCRARDEAFYMCVRQTNSLVVSEAFYDEIHRLRDVSNCSFNILDCKLPPTFTCHTWYNVELNSGYFGSVARDLEDYNYHGFLGEGGNGSVHLLVDKISKVQVAVKGIHWGMGRSPSTPHIRRELRILQQLQHPNIVNFKFCLLRRAKLYIVMEYIRGGTLRQIITQHKPVLNDLKIWFAQLVSGLAYLHDNGIMHRDVKPSNCMIDTFGRLKLTDFGLALQKEEYDNKKKINQKENDNSDNEIDTSGHNVNVNASHSNSSNNSNNGGSNNGYNPSYSNVIMNNISHNSPNVAQQVQTNHLPQTHHLSYPNHHGNNYYSNHYNNKNSYSRSATRQKTLTLGRTTRKLLQNIFPVRENHDIIKQETKESILVIDSSKDRLYENVSLLQQDFTVWSANNDDEAIDLLTNRSTHKIDIILMDLGCSNNTTGWGFLSELWKNDEWKDTPVIILTDSNDLSFDSSCWKTRLPHITQRPRLILTHPFDYHANRYYFQMLCQLEMTSTIVRDTKHSTNRKVFHGTVFDTMFDNVYRQRKRTDIDLDNKNSNQNSLPIEKEKIRGIGLVGTVQYMAPEMLSSEGKEPYTEAVDWWSTGVLIFECLTHKRLFEGSNHAFVARDIINCDMDERLRLYYDLLNDDVTRDLMNGMLQKDPKKRYGETKIKDHPFFNSHILSTEGSIFKVYSQPKTSTTYNFDKTCVTLPSDFHELSTSQSVFKPKEKELDRVSESLFEKRKNSFFSTDEDLPTRSKRSNSKAKDASSKGIILPSLLESNIEGDSDSSELDQLESIESIWKS